MSKKPGGGATFHEVLEERLRRLDAQQLEAQVVAAEERRIVGRYTLDEAADSLSRETGERCDLTLVKLIRAVESGELPTYEPQRHARMMYEGPGDVCSFYEEVYWDDLNKWLAIMEPRMSYTFPMPAKPERSKHQSDDRSEIPRPVPRSRAQEDAILNTLRDLGFNPQQLPQPKPGKRSAAKNAARSKLPYTSNMFDKAWKRLQHDGRVKYASV